MARHTLAMMAMLSIALHGPLQAQSLVARPGDVDRRASVAITIPFGGKKSEETKPRMELLMSQDRAPNQDTRYDFEHMYRPRESRIGFTLDKQPSLMVNGRVVQSQENKARMGTWGYVAIGVGVALLTGAVLLADKMRDASE